MERRSDRELLAAFARRDEAAFTVFYERHARAVHAHLAQLLTGEPEVEEAMQDVFLLASSKWRAITYADGSARGWLLGAARNIASNRARSARRRKEGAPLPAPDPTIPTVDVQSQVELRFEVSAVEQIVGTMDTLDQRIYRAALVEGHSHADTARMLGLAPATVRQRFARIRKHLQAQLRGGDGD